MIDARYLSPGLNAMAKAHLVNTMAGHLGAAVVAGCFIPEQHPDLDDVVCRGIEGEFERIIRGESAFSPKEGAGISAPEMFGPLPEEDPDPGLVPRIAEALAGNIDQTRQSGHNVIFASIAIRALADNPALARPSVVEGIRKLIAGFDGASPGSGYYGKEKGRIDGRQIEVAADGAFPPYDSLEAMANTVFGDLIRHAPERRTGYGGLWHIINHAAALAELTRYGYEELAAKGLAAHRRHLRLWRTVPDTSEEEGTETPAEHDPRTAPYWRAGGLRRDRARLTHRIKTLFGFDALVGLVDDKAVRRQANDALRYLM